MNADMVTILEVLDFQRFQAFVLPNVIIFFPVEIRHDGLI